jgi:predicted nucleic acid-binding protein
LNLYLDTSALVKLYVEEDGSPAVREAVANAESVATAALAYVEARAAFARRHREKRLSPDDYRRTVQELEADWEHYLLLEITSGLIKTAAELAANHALRAYDAIHLAAAKLLRARLQGPILFACWDGHLSAAARREGLALVRKK